MQISQEQYENYTKELEAAIAVEKARSGEMARAQVSQMSVFNSENEQNLIQWQLDLREDLDSIYHLLQGHMIVEDQEGNMGYQEPDNPNLKPFNEFGVQLLMNILSFYLNRNTILSNYSEDTINWKVYDIGIEISDLIHNRYHEMMNTLPESATSDEVEHHLKEKVKLYPMIVRELVDTIHSAYLRAYHGGERESLRTARTVTQSEPLARFGQQPQTFAPPRKTSVFKPWTWGG